MSDSQVNTPWPWTSLGEVADIAGGLTLGRPLSGTGTVELPYLRVANVQDGHIDTSEMKYVRVLRSEVARYELRAGDFLMTEGGDFDKLGRGAVWDGSIAPCLHQNHIFRVRTNSARLLPSFLAIYATSHAARRYFVSASKQTTNLATINMTQVKAFPIPLPPVGEQRKIIDAYGSVEESIRSTDAYIAKLETIERGLTVELLGRSGGWRAVRLGDLTNGRPKNGYSPREVDYHTGTLMLGLGCLTPSGFIPRQLKNAPHNDPGLRRAELADGDLLMSRSNTRGSVGLVGRFSSVGNRCIYPDLMMRLVPNASVRAGFLEVLLRSPAARKQIEANAVGTSGSMVKINASTVLGLELKIPDLSEQDRIIDNLAVSRAPIRAARDRRDKLHQLRQGLIDDLLAGRVRLNSGEEVSV